MKMYKITMRDNYLENQEIQLHEKKVETLEEASQVYEEIFTHVKNLIVEVLKLMQSIDVHQAGILQQIIDVVNELEVNEELELDARGERFLTSRENWIEFTLAGKEISLKVEEIDLQEENTGMMTERKVDVDLKYKNYIFDLYGTLIDIHTDEEDENLWKALAKYYRDRGANYRASGIHTGYLKYVKEELKKSEEIQVEKVFRKLFEKKGVEVSDEVVLETCRFFRDTSTEYLKLYTWSLPILETLKANGKKVFLLSNAQRSFTYHEMEKLDIVKYFDAIYISSDYGVKKPNAKFFQTLIEKEGLDVSECLMLGNDQTCDILGAQGVGMDTWYVHTNCSPEYTKDVKATYEFL